MNASAGVVPTSTLASGWLIEWSVAVAIVAYFLAHTGLARLTEIVS